MKKCERCGVESSDVTNNNVFCQSCKMMNRLINDMNLSDIPYERVSEYIKLEQAQDIKNTASNVEKISKNIGIIKNCVVFFTVMSAIGIVAAVIGFLLS